jgi:hypothetical protein
MLGMTSALTRAFDLRRTLPARNTAIALFCMAGWGCSSATKTSSTASHGDDPHADMDHGDSTEDHDEGQDEDEEAAHGGENTDTDSEQGGMEMGGEPPPPNEEALPNTLSETGLYSDIAAKTIASEMLHYVPQFQLWSDGADKARWAYIPDGMRVDTEDMNDWSVPVGSRFFKEFSLDGRRIETRLIERVGDGPRDFAFVSYLWNDDETEATKVGPEGLAMASGTNHDVPSKLQCLRCHGTHPLGGGRPSRMLGFSAVQLSHDDASLALSDLAERMTTPLETPYTVPGDPKTQAALGYLHANCGNCHNGERDRIPQVDLSFWLNVEHTTEEETDAWKTAVSQANAIFNDQHVIGRIVPGNAEESAVIYRMSQRNNTAQMPPLATKVADETGIDAVTEWIRSLP